MSKETKWVGYSILYLGQEKKKIYRAPSSTEGRDRETIWEKKNKPSIRSSLPGADFVVRVYIEMGPARWVGEWLRHCRSVRYTTPGSQKQFIFRAVEWGEGSERSLYAYLASNDPRSHLGSVRFWDSASKALGQGRRRPTDTSNTTVIIFEDLYRLAGTHRYIFRFGNNSPGNRDINSRGNRLPSERVNNSPAIDYN